MDWTPEKGYNADLPKNYYPRVSGGTGSRLGLTVVLNSSASEYYCTKSKSVGFKVATRKYYINTFYCKITFRNPIQDFGA